MDAIVKRASVGKKVSTKRKRKQEEEEARGRGRRQQQSLGVKQLVFLIILNNKQRSTEHVEVLPIT